MKNRRTTKPKEVSAGQNSLSSLIRVANSDRERLPKYPKPPKTITLFPRSHISENETSIPPFLEFHLKQNAFEKSLKRVKGYSTSSLSLPKRPRQESKAPRKMLHFRQLSLLKKNKVLSKMLIFENYKEELSR